MIIFKRFIIVVWLLTFMVAGQATVYAKSISFIRDTETENTIRAFAAPLLRTAGLDVDAIKIHLINSSELNAFVAGGQNLFINTGLIMRSENALQVIGVIAHEIGHIAGGHIIKLHDAQKGASTEALIGAILGGAVAVLGGRPDAGLAIAGGGLHVGTRNLLRFSRTQETAADRAGLRYLERTRLSSRGLLEFLDILGDQELLSIDRQDPYVRTHPLGRERIEFIHHHQKKSKYTNAPVPPEFCLQHARMKAKLRGYTQPPSLTFRQYRESDNSFPARYARAIAYYRIPKMDKALELINGLIRERPDDPYLYDVKGQFLFESGGGAKALAPYERAVSLLPDSPLIRVDLARVQLELKNPEMDRRAITNLLVALDKEPRRSFAWRQLGIAYGRLNFIGESSRALAEEASLQGRHKDAVRLSERALKLLKAGSPDWIRAEDILTDANHKSKKRK